jgi:hypothetical protein
MSKQFSFYDLGGHFIYEHNDITEDDLTNFTGIIKDIQGVEYYYKNGVPHRETGPAIVYSTGTEYWYTNGNLNRLEDAAVVCSDGHKEYWVNGINIKANNMQEFRLYVDLLKLKKLI